MPTFSLTRPACVLLFGAFLAGAASAATYTVDESLDLTAPVSSGADYAIYQGFGTSPSLSLAVGDSLDYTVQFLAGQSLSLKNVQYLWGFVTGASDSTNVVATGQLQLLDASGNVVLTSNEKTDTEGLSHVGQSFVSADFAGGLPSVVTFSGIHYVGTVDEYADGSTSRDYPVAGFVYVADPAMSAVPEPANIAMMLVGVGLLGAAGLRRKA